MKVKEHSHLRGQNGCLGFFYGLDALLSAYPEGGLPGEFFINGKTQSIWVWDATGRSWYDSNHAAPAPFFDVITDPATFSPGVESGVSACFIYIAGRAGSYQFPALKGSSTLTVTTTSAAVIALVWNGTSWRDYVTPLSLENVMPPNYMYRGAWSETLTYIYADGIVDVVYYQGRYYRVKQEGSITGEVPDQSSNWERLTRFYTVAGKLDMPQGEVLRLNQQQAIRVESGDSSWDLCDGIIKHMGTGTLLSQAGELRIPVEGGEVIIGPSCRGIKYMKGEDTSLVFDLDSTGNARILMIRREESGKIQMYVMPHALTLTRFDNYGNIIRFNSMTVDGINWQLKKWSDNLIEGDIYVDENNFLKQKGG